MINGSLSLQYSTTSTSSGLLLEMHDKFGLAPAGQWPVRLYPSVPALVSASVGAAALMPIYGTRKIARELLAFRGSTRAKPHYPISRLVNILIRHPLQTITSSGFAPVSLSHTDFHLDSQSGEIVCSRAIYGAVLVDYDADYRLIYYTPDRTSGGYYGGATVEVGTVYAWHNGQDAELQINYSRSSAQLRSPLYVAYSHGVVDADFTPGTINGYEMPDDWPSDESYYSLQPSADVPDPAASATIERPHRRGEYDLIGSIWETNIDQQILTPYRGFTTYHPKIWVRFADAPDPGSRMEDAYQRAIAEKSRILSELASLYPKFQGEAS